MIVWEITASKLLLSWSWTTKYINNLKVNWNIEVLTWVTVRESTSTSLLDIRWNLLNKWTITNWNYNWKVNLYWSVQNDWKISSNFYLKWPIVSWATNYNVTVTSITWATVYTNEFLLPNYTWTWSNILWYAEWNWITTPKKCINVPGCINSDWSTNPISPFLVYWLDGSYYNNNLISSKNINYYSKLFFDSVFHVKSLKNQLISYIFENTSLWDPVNLANWEFDYDNTPMSYNSEGMPFEFKVKYRTNAYYNWPLWNKFDHNYNIYLTEDNYWNIDYHDWKLWAFKFTKTSTWYLYNDTINANLTMSWLNYVVKFDDQKIYSFGLNSRVQNIKDAFGNVMIFTYNNNSELTKITDTLGREYLISYHPDSRIKDLTDFNWNKVEFIYFWTWDIHWNQYDLKTIKMTNSWSTKQIWFTYNTWSTFESSHNIIKLIDSAWNTYVENTYDSNNRVLTQKYWSGTINYDYTLDENNEYIAKNIVTDREWNVIEYYFNSSGNTTKKIVKKSSWDLEYNYVYDGKSNLIKEIKPLWNGVKYTYDSHNNILEKRLKQDINAADSSSDIVYSSTYDLRYNKPSQTSSPGWMLTNYTFDDKWNITRKQLLLVKDYEDHTLTISWSYVYNSKWQLIKETNARWLETTFEYGSWNLIKIKKWTWATAIENNFQYDSKWNLVKIIDGRGKETILSYNNFNLITQKLTPESIATQYTYNNLNKKTNEKIIFGSWSDLNTDYEYDILDNLTKVIQDVDANKTLEKNVSYDLNSRIIQEKLWNWATIKYIYDENWLLIQKKVESWAWVNWDLITTYTYDNNERLISETNPRGKTTNYEYDLYDRIIKKTLPDGTYESYFYDKDANIIKIEKYSSWNILLSKEENIYDRRGKNLWNKKYLLGWSGSILSTYSKYDENWNITKSIDSKWKETNYSYDIYDRLIETSDSLWNKIINTYDKNNNIVSKKVKQSNNKETTTTYAYDDDNRLTSETNELNKTKNYTYNKLNQITSITDEKWNITNYTYDYAWKVKSETKVLSSWNIVTSYTYDERWNMLSVIDGKWNTTNYEYDNLNRLVKQTYPDNKFTSYTYDKNSNIKTKTDPNWTTVTNTYDDLDRIISKSITTWSGVSWVTSENFTYDSLWRLISATDSNNHNLTFTYDSLNRLLQENQSWSVVSYSYDNNNNLLSITNPNNNVINYTYDDINRVTSIKKNSENIADYTYTWFENTSIALWNSTSITKTYDELSRLSSLNNSAKIYNYSYDDVWNITSDNFKNYDYDEIYRLTWVSNSWWTLESLSYDKVWNRLNNFNALIWSWANYEYNVNILNQYTTLSWSVNKYVIEEIISELEWRSSGRSGSWEVQSWSWETNSWSWNTESGSWSETWSWETESSSWETNTWSTNEESWTWDIQEEDNTWTWEETNSSSWKESWSWVAIWELKTKNFVVYWTSEEESGSWIITYSWWLVNFDDSTNYVYDNNWNIINNWKYKFIYDYKNRIVEVTDLDNIIFVEYSYDILDRRYKKETPNKLVKYTFSNENILEENITNSWSSTITKEYINW
jgi:YD repeat-containing protein